MNYQGRMVDEKNIQAFCYSQEAIGQWEASIVIFP